MSNRIDRHPPVVRICHWLIAISGLLLVFSGFGFMPLYGRFYVNTLPGLGWVADFAIQMQLHYISSLLFSAAGTFHLFYHWRRRETQAWPRKGDMKESAAIIRAMAKGEEEPPQDKFLAEQRLVYAAFVGVSLVLLLSGLFLAFKNSFGLFFDPLLIQLMIFTHMLTTMIFIGLILGHLAAFLIKANRPLLPSMFSGKVDRTYAEHRHALWKATIKK